MLSRLLRKNQDALTVGTLMLFGGILRFLPGWLAGFPINDGGMFLTMIRDLQANRFVLPSVTSYNFSEIPFAYPPFGFYLTGLLSDLLSVPPIELLRWAPPIVSVVIIPAFYWISLTLDFSRAKAAIATALYALFPSVADWLIMGGGITRSFGILFLLFSVGFVYKLFRTGGAANLTLSIVFCALTILSHPEAGLQVAVLCLVLWLLYGRTIAGLKHALALSVGVFLATSIWWLTVLMTHGLAPFLSAMQTGARERMLESIFHTFFSYQGDLPLLPFLVLIGLVAVIRGRDIFPILWAFIPFLVDPRNAPSVAIFSLLILAANGLVFLNNEYIRLTGSGDLRLQKGILQYVPAAILLAVLSYLFLVSLGAAQRLATYRLTESQRMTIEWIRQNTPKEGRYLLITNTGQLASMLDPYQEWFPALAQRKSVNTIQGLEWIAGARFFPYAGELISLQRCEDAACLERWLKVEGAHADYYLILKNRSSPELLASLRSRLSSVVVFESSDAVIFEAPP